MEGGSFSKCGASLRAAHMCLNMDSDIISIMACAEELVSWPRSLEVLKSHEWCAGTIHGCKNT
eukprot:99241-Pyramimonas_sp.AAC.1